MRHKHTLTAVHRAVHVVLNLELALEAVATREESVQLVDDESKSLSTPFVNKFNSFDVSGLVHAAKNADTDERRKDLVHVISRAAIAPGKV